MASEKRQCVVLSGISEPTISDNLHMETMEWASGQAKGSLQCPQVELLM